LYLTRHHGPQFNQDLGSDQPSSGDAQINKALQQRRRLAVDAKKSMPRSPCQEVDAKKPDAKKPVPRSPCQELRAMLPAECDYRTSKP
jgi:hypothetical protein